MDLFKILKTNYSLLYGIPNVAGETAFPTKPANTAIVKI